MDKKNQDEIWDLIISQKGEIDAFEQNSFDLVKYASDQLVNNTDFTEYHSTKSENTIIQYQQALKSFENFISLFTKQLNSENPVFGLFIRPHNWKHITKSLVKNYVKYLILQGYAFETINRYLSVIKMHSKWATDMGHMSFNVYSQIKNIQQYNVAKETRTRKNMGWPKKKIPGEKGVLVIDLKTGDQVNSPNPLIGVKKSEAQVLDQTQIDLLLATCNSKSLIGKRDLAILTIFLDLGLRVGELVILDIDLIDFQRNLITVFRPKVSLTQKMRMSNRIRYSLLDYISHCPFYFSNKVFLSFSYRSINKKHPHLGKPITERSVRRMIQKRGEQIGLEISLGPHDLRHTHFTQQADKKVPLPQLMKAGGWSNPRTAMRYISDAEVVNEGMTDLAK